MNPETKSRIFTVGHGNAPFQEIERILRLHGVATLVDVRSAPYSRYAPDFRKSALAEYAASAGFGYRWMGDRLGTGKGGSDRAVRKGETDGQPEVDPSSIRDALAQVIALNETGPVALLCAERDAEHCHRSLVLAPQLETLGCEVFHIHPNGTASRHQPSLGI